MQINNNPGYTFGTWVPKLYFGAATTGITYTGRDGNWIRIGNAMFVWGGFVLSSKGTAVGAASIRNLPFTSRINVASVRYPVTISGGGPATTLPLTPLSVLMANIASGSAVITFTKVLVSTGAVTAIDDTNFTDTDRVMFSTMYSI